MSAAANPRGLSRQEREAQRELWLTSFLHERHWPEVRLSAQSFESGKVDQAQAKSVLALVLTVLTDGFESVQTDALRDVQQDEHQAAVFVCFYNVLSTALHKRLSPEQLAGDLAEKIQLPAFSTKLLVTAYKTRYDDLSQAAASRRISLPGFADLQWRVDVTISTTALSRVFTPTILMRLTLTDGTMKTFECSVESFHQLRYQVAKALRNVHGLSNHPTLNRLES